MLMAIIVLMISTVAAIITMEWTASLLLPLGMAYLNLQLLWPTPERGWSPWRHGTSVRIEVKR